MKGIREKYLGHLVITSSSSHFFNKTDFEQYLFKELANTFSNVGPDPVPSLRGGGGEGQGICTPLFWFIQNTFTEHYARRQQAIMEKGIMTFKHNSRLKFSHFFAKLPATNCCTEM